MGDKAAHGFFPDLFSFQVERADDELALMGEDQVDLFSITGRRGVGPAASGHAWRVPASFVELAAPEQLPILARITESELFLLFLVRCRQEDPLADDGRGGMSPAGNRGFPDDVGGFAPFEWGIGAGGDAISIRSPPVGPVLVRRGWPRKNEQPGQGQQGGGFS